MPGEKIDSRLVSPGSEHVMSLEKSLENRFAHTL
jgi:hypothetical protein